MKIFYPVEVFFPSQAGGPANTVYWITKNLIPHGIVPVIAATDKGLGERLPVDRWLETDGGRAIYVRTPRLNFPLHQTLIALRAFRECDIVHLSSIFFPTAFIVGIAARVLRKKTVWSARGELDRAALNHSRLRKLPVLTLIRLLVGRYPLYHSTCDEETGYIRDIFGAGARVVQIPNYLEIPEPVARCEGRYILYIGRFHPKKAIENLIGAVAASGAFRASGYRLLIAGTGKPEFELPLRKLVTDKGLENLVEFVGQVEGAAKQQLLADALVTVMPSHTENFGVVVLESLAQGTPAIASKGTPWKILESERIGNWIANDPGSIAAALERFIAMPETEYLEMRERCRPLVERDFDIKSNIGKWLEVYNNL